VGYKTALYVYPQDLLPVQGKAERLEFLATAGEANEAGKRATVLFLQAFGYNFRTYAAE